MVPVVLSTSPTTVSKNPTTLMIENGTTNQWYNKEDDDNDNTIVLLHHFQQWVQNLDWNELHSSSSVVGGGLLQFPIRSSQQQQQQQNKTNCMSNVTTNNNTTTKKKKHNSNDYIKKKQNLVSSSTTAAVHHQNSSNKDEYDILQEMVQLQEPLPIPIHPRAISYIPASQMGRNYIEPISYLNNNNNNNNHNDNHCCYYTQKPKRWLRFIDNNNNHHHRNTTNKVTEEEEEKLLSMLSQSNSKHSNYKNSKSKKKEMAKSVTTNQSQHGYNNNNYNNTSTVSDNYYTTMDIIARQFRQDDGTILTIPCCNQIQCADYILLHGTKIIVSNTLTNNKLDDTNDDMNYTYCRLEVQENQFGTSISCWDLLRYTSRGLFATRTVPIQQCCMNGNNNSNNMILSFPLWFDPTQRWFPLSMYLTARYEVALWKLFYQQQQQQQRIQNQHFCTIAATIRTTKTISTATIAEQYGIEPSNYSSTINALLVRSLVHSVKRILCQDANTLLTSKAFHIRDILLWNELTNFVSLTSILDLISIKNDIVESLWECPLLQMGSNHETLRQHVRDQFQVTLTEYSMEQLLNVEDNGGATGTIMGNEPSRSNSKKRTKKKKVQSKTCTVDTIPITTLNHLNDDDNESSSSSSDDKVAFGIKIARMIPPKIHNEHISDRQRSRNTVLCLSILDDIMNNVFRQVGIHDFVEQISEVKVTKLSQALPHERSGNNLINNETILVGSDITPYETETNTFKSEETEVKDVSSLNILSSDELLWNYDRDHCITTTIPERENINLDSEVLSVHKTSFDQTLYVHPMDATATIRTSNLQMISSTDGTTFTPGFFHPPGAINDIGWDGPGYFALDSWSRFQGIGRNESLLTDYFHKQDPYQNVAASSTAASIASSDKGYDYDTSFEVNDFGCENFVPNGIDRNMSISTPPPELAEPLGPLYEDDKSIIGSAFHSPSPPSTPSPTLSPILVSLSELSQLPQESLELLQIPSSDIASIPSYVQQGLSAFKVKLDHTDTSQKPVETEKECKTLTRSTRENIKKALAENDLLKRLPEIKVDKKLPPKKCRDDHDIIDKATVRRSADALKSYRNIGLHPKTDSSKHNDDVSKRELKKVSSYKTISAIKSCSPQSAKGENSKRNNRSFLFDFSPSMARYEHPVTTRSELAENENYQSWRDGPVTRTDEIDNNTVTKDGATTISSNTSQREPDEIAILREQRNVYRDMCLTLGSEVAKLKNVLAAQACTSFQPVVPLQPTFDFHPCRVADSFDPSVFNIGSRAQTLAALSDAGYRGELAALSDAGYRGELESLASEDDFAARRLANENSMHFSIGPTNAINSSDASHCYITSASTEAVNLRVQPSKGSLDVLSQNSIQSRLAREIYLFLERNTTQLRQLDKKIQTAIERMNRLVKTVWPRAQVKLYGSHVTGLSVASSDLDFVVCLPAVHKNDIAVAPGALEGRNAINESSQKLLARRLKGESWIDPRSMKLVERTAVPVIKVSTKDVKKCTLHLDISFDGPGHHGLDAVQMMTSIMNDLPLLRPLVIVLKQFLIERSLLEAYTGGLSSYGLSLMVARYLQEQSSEADVGSLLMGFLDFYGNYFDPRSTGISVRKRQYFARPNYYAARNPGYVPMCGPTFTTSPSTVQLRRNSFSDKEGPNERYGRTTFRNQNLHGATQLHGPVPPPPPSNVFQTTIPDERNSFDNGMPYTFDPLFIEDPLSAGNNVGRNAFRIFQVQRAFSDAHRALVAALEWEDIYTTSSGAADVSLPLLKCLLHSEDVVYDL